jgi:NTE family protein
LKIGITLSGGASKGIAHIGVLQALQENNIHPTIISGTSAGSIVGALYAASVSPTQMMELAHSSSLYKIVKSGFSFSGNMRLTYLTDLLAQFIKKDDFSALDKKLYVCATNIETGSADIFHEGPLFDIIEASCCLPWLFAPVVINNMLYVDGGVRENMPAKCIRNEVDFLIGVNVKPKVIAPKEELNSRLNVGLRVFDLSIWNNIKPSVRLLDHYIAPEKLVKFNQFSMKQADEMYQVGYEAAMANMDDLKKKLDKKMNQINSTE